MHRDLDPPRPQEQERPDISRGGRVGADPDRLPPGRDYRDVFVRDLRSGALQQLTRGNEAAARLQWSRDGALVWRVGHSWYRWDGRTIAQAAQLKAEDAPGTPPKADDLRERQLRMIQTLKTDRERREAARLQQEAWRSADPTRAPAPVYLGRSVDIVDSALSPDGRWLLVATTVTPPASRASNRRPRIIASAMSLTWNSSKQRSRVWEAITPAAGAMGSSPLVSPKIAFRSVLSPLRHWPIRRWTSPMKTWKWTRRFLATGAVS